MTYSTTWDVSFCEFNVEPDNKQKVTSLHWECVVADDVSEELVRAYGTVSAADQNRVYTQAALQAVPKATFIQWIHQALGEEEVTAIEAGTTAALDSRLTPTQGGFVPE